jgi:hypothetical protein
MFSTMPLSAQIAPLPIIENTDTGDRFLVYHGKDGVDVELLVLGESFCATQAQMAQMFGVTKQAISRHLKRIFAEGELIEASVVNQKLTTASDDKAYRTQLYDLNAIIAVGYRIEGKLGTMFRIWATDKLFQYLAKGFVIHMRRLSEPDGKGDFFDELLEKIRDIRASEKRMWKRILELATFCADYDPKDTAQRRDFFGEIQNTLHWAVTGQTAGELIRERVDASRPNAGLTQLRGKMPTIAEAGIAKNVMAEPEIKALNLVTCLMLDFFESQAERRQPTTLQSFLGKLRDLIRLDERPLKPLGHQGSVNADAKEEWVALQIGEYRSRKRLEFETEGERALTQIADSVKTARRKQSR